MCRRRFGLIAAALVASVVAGLAAAPPAQPAVLCWQSVLNAWAHDDLGSNYPLHCYRQAVKHLPADVRGYSSAPDDIQRALIGAIGDSAKKRTTASVHNGGTRTPLSATKVNGGSSKTMLPLPLVILAGWLVVAAAGSAVLVRRRRRAPPHR